MTSLVEFIEERLEEDEEVAREASGETWIHDDRGVAHSHPTWTADYETIKPRFPDGHPVAAERIALAFPDHPMGSTVVARHIARQDPARVLREVKSKRELLRDLENAGCSWCAEEPPAPEPGITGYGYSLAKHLARPFADHPDYNPAWSE